MEATCTASGQYQKSGGIDVASSSEVIVGKLLSVQLTSKELIQFAGDENETTYPAGSELQVDLGFKPTVSGNDSSSTKARVWIIDRDGNRLADVTEFICVSFDFRSLIFSGRYDPLTYEENTRNRFAAKMHLRFPSKGIWMTFRGNCTELYKLGAPNSDGDQREHGNIIFTGDGSGFFDNLQWVGKIVAQFVGRTILNFD